MRIALDAMGGDLAPSVNIDGALEAVQVQNDLQITLVGLESSIQEALKGKKYNRNLIGIQHASQVVDMHESPSVAVRRKKDSSIRVGIDMVKSGKADAFVSAGHSGVVMATSLLVLGKSKVVDRPAIAAIMPCIKGTFVLLDAGATVDCKPENLLQFAIMGNTYCKLVLGKTNPRVAILSIGEEDSKGNEMTKEAFKLVRNANLNFIGNIEGKDVFKSKADVIVCDGFIGNVALKISEGLAETVLKMLKQEITKVSTGRLGYFMMKPAITNFKKRTDYDEFGGAPLLGINGTSIISHGRSSVKAIRNAIFVASDYARKKVYEQISLNIERDLENRSVLA